MYAESCQTFRVIIYRNPATVIVYLELLQKSSVQFQSNIIPYRGQFYPAGSAVLLLCCVGVVAALLCCLSVDTALLGRCAPAGIFFSETRGTMATRRGRSRAAAHVTDNILSSEPNVGALTNSYYDMSYPENWTVTQLRAELDKNGILFRKTAKKSKLIQLCQDNGLIRKSTENQAVLESGTNEKQLASISASVEELHKTVQLLSGTVNKLVTARSDSNTNNENLQSTVVNQQSAVSAADNSVAAILAGQCEPSSALSGYETGQVTRFGYSAESLPFVETIHPTLRKQIIEGKDVNLSALLIPYYTGPHADPSATTKEKPDPRLNNTLTLPQFIQAFGIYKNIMCETYPSRRLELDLYERDIIDMATRYNGRGFYEYHKTFSAQAAAHLRYSNKKVDWSIRNNKLFASIFVNHRASVCYICNSSLHSAAFCPNHLNEKSKQYPNQNQKTIDVAGRARLQFNGREICNNFNAVKGCQFPNCRRAHVCLTCKKEHSQQTCDSKNSQATTSSKQK